MSGSPSFARRLRRHAEAALMRLALRVFRLPGLDRASALGGMLGQAIGPRLGVNRIAWRNLRACLPEKSEAEIAAIVHGMWDNLGRTAAECAHLDRFQCYAADSRVEVRGVEFIEQAVAGGKGAIFVGGHLGNWELQPLAVAQRGLAVMEIYRAASNPLADAIITALRRRHVTPHQIAKGGAGKRMMLRWLQQKNYIAMLVDQKMNDGIEAPFFGRPSMCPPAAAQLARRFGCPVIPVTMHRAGGAYFVQTFEAPIFVPQTGDRERDVLAVVSEINARLERFIRAHPSQWLWLHRRWPR